MLYILLAGGVFNAVLVPQLVRAMRNDADGGEAYTNRIVTLAGALPARRHDRAGRLRPGGDVALPRQRLRRPRPHRAAGLGDRLRALLPAAGLLLRHVRAGRADPQRARRLRADDVGADRQQRHLGRDAGRLPVHLRPGQRRRAVRAATPRARSCCSASARRWASPRSWSSWCPTSSAPGFTFRPRFDFRGSGLGHTFRLGLWTVLFVIVNQIAYTVVVRLASSGTAGGGLGPGGRGHRLHRLLLGLPDRDGAALDHHRLARHRDPAAALGPRRRRATSPASAPPWPPPCARRWPSSSGRRAAPAGGPRRRPRHLGLRRRGRRLRLATPRHSPSSARDWCSSPSTT